MTVCLADFTIMNTRTSQIGQDKKKGFKIVEDTVNVSACFLNVDSTLESPVKWAFVGIQKRTFSRSMWKLHNTKGKSVKLYYC